MKNMSSWRALGGLDGDPAIIIHPSGPLTGGGVGAAGEGEGEAMGATGDAPPPHDVKARVRARNTGAARMASSSRAQPSGKAPSGDDRIVRAAGMSAATPTIARTASRCLLT
jgi:hypothetical protein